MVHVLKYGRPLCGFATELPIHWPAGHRFVAFHDRELLDRVDCPGCRATLKLDAAASKRGRR